MNDSYKELLVKKEKGMKENVLRIGCIVATVLFCFFALMVPYAFVIVIVLGVLDYFVFQLTDIEYEYLYLDKEINIDKIMAKNKRKRVAVLSIDKMEILAPEKSHQLDSYRNRTVKTADYSAGQDLPGEKVYAMYYEGNQKFLLNLDEDFAKTVKGIAPRKVFLD